MLRWVDAHSGGVGIRDQPENMKTVCPACIRIRYGLQGGRCQRDNQIIASASNLLGDRICGGDISFRVVSMQVQALAVLITASFQGLQRTSESVLNYGLRDVLPHPD